MKTYDTLHIYEINLPYQVTFSPSLGQDFIGIWTEGQIGYLFFHTQNHEVVQNWLKTLGDSAGLLSYYDISYEAWQGGNNVTGFEAGGLQFIPIWEKPKPGDIIFDPSVVFGNGQHPTTRACLEIMTHVMKNDAIQTVLDLGTGSGLLALGAAKMGAKVCAVDINLLAVETARKNVVLNRFEENIRVIHGDVLKHRDVYADIWLANLPHLVLMDLFTGMNEGHIPFKWAIVSGIFPEQSWELSHAITNSGISVESVQPADSWVTLLLKASK